MHSIRLINCLINQTTHPRDSSDMADAATSLTPGFQRLNTATPALSASPGGGGGRRGTKGRGAAAAAAAGSRATAANAMVLETPPVSSSSSSLNGSGAPPRLRPEALARKLRRLAAEALDKVGKEETPTDTYRRVEPSHLTSPFPLPNPNRRIHQRLHARAAFYADKLVTLGQSAAVPAPAPTPQGAAERKDQQQQPLLPLSQQQRAQDVLLLAKAYHQGRDYRRAVHTLERHGLLAVKVPPPYQGGGRVSSLSLPCWDDARRTNRTHSPTVGKQTGLAGAVDAAAAAPAVQAVDGRRRGLLVGAGGLLPRDPVPRGLGQVGEKEGIPPTQLSIG